MYVTYFLPQWLYDSLYFGKEGNQPKLWLVLYLLVAASVENVGQFEIPQKHRRINSIHALELNNIGSSVGYRTCQLVVPLCFTEGFLLEIEIIGYWTYTAWLEEN